ncbi:hypothetical protein AB7M35_000668 [Amorphus suaedae]
MRAITIDGPNGLPPAPTRAAAPDDAGRLRLRTRAPAAIRPPFPATPSIDGVIRRA